jgi:hypothetical protein
MSADPDEAAVIVAKLIVLRELRALVAEIHATLATSEARLQASARRLVLDAGCEDQRATIH